jgi:hypothetical protein
MARIPLRLCDTDDWSSTQRELLRRRRAGSLG